MKRCTLLIIFIPLFLYPRNDLSAGILEPYKPYLDSLLQTVNMHRGDLHMPWDIVTDDPYRLDVIRNCFEDPFYTMTEVHNQAEFLRDYHDAPFKLFEFIGSKLDVKLPDTADYSPLDMINRMDRFRLKRRFPDHYNSILSFLDAASVAEQLYKEAFAELTHEETEHLKAKMPGLYRSLTNSNWTERPSGLIERREAQRESRKAAQELFSLAKKFEVRYVLVAAAILYDAGLELAGSLKENPLADKSLTFNTPLGIVAIGTVPDHIPFLMIPPEKDNYISWEKSDDDPSIQVIIAPGGDNVYKGDHYSLGSGFFGLGLLIDIKGNDQYISKSYSQGSGFFGAGMIVDMAGDDYYRSSITSQGSGGFGAGLVIDYGGNDVYQGGQYVQGSGWVNGYGALISLGGSDRFITSADFIDYIRYEDRYLSLSQGMGMGYRPYASGGIGMLVNAGGHNLYQTEIFGQGSGYWYALGGLVDLSGNDQYLSHQYSQGAGIHMAFGALLDLGGDDHFKSHGVSQGCGHDYGFGGFYSAGGDDVVVCHGLSQGAGNANGSGLFINGGGNNGYIAKNDNTQGYSDHRRGFGMTGLFLNTGKASWYGAVNGSSGSWWTSGTYGAGRDVLIKESEAVRTREESKDTARIIENIGSDPETLFLQATDMPITVQYLVSPARDSLAAMGEEALAHLMHYLDSDLPREIHALRRLVRMFDEKPTKYLKDSLLSENSYVSATSLNLLIEMAKDSLGRGAMERVLPLREHENWKRRAAAYRYIGYYGDEALISYILDGLNDDHYHVRRTASEAMYRSAGTAYFETMADLLGDPSQQVRYNAEKYFGQHGKDAVMYLLDNVVLNEELDELSRLHALSAIARTEYADKETLEKLEPVADEGWRFRESVEKIVRP